jgi:hypothetical protein
MQCPKRVYIDPSLQREVPGVEKVVGGFTHRAAYHCCWTVPEGDLGLYQLGYVLDLEGGGGKAWGVRGLIWHLHYILMYISKDWG